MSKSFNSVNIMGNLTRDPELRSTPNGRDVVGFSLAVNRSYKVNDEWQEETAFVDCTAWGDLALRISTSLAKGSSVFVDGRLQSRSWEQDGQKRSKLEVVADKVIFLTDMVAE